MKRFMAVFVVCALDACAAPKTVSLPDGRTGLEVDCSGTAHSYSDCMNKAAEACHGQYQVVDKDGNSTGTMAMPFGNSVMYAQGIHRTMTVVCNSQNQ